MSLTDARFQRVKHVFDWYRVDLGITGVLDYQEFAQEVKTALKIGNPEFTGIVFDLAKHDQYLPLAAMCMEQGYPSIAAEFQPKLAELYGVALFLTDDREEKRKAFWTRICPNKKL